MLLFRGYGAALVAILAASIASTNNAFIIQGVPKGLLKSALGTELTPATQQIVPATGTRLFAAPTMGSGVKSVEQYVQERGGKKAIKKVLIANNGMAGTKSILSMRQWAYMELGDERAIQFVAMASPEDIKANAEFVRLADSFVEVPGGANKNNYANVELITKIAVEQGVDAVWPGWGHASEKPELPTALSKHGIKFIGPTAPVMSVLGDKIAANILAQTAEVPSIPWSGSFGGPNDGPLVAELTEEGTIPPETFEKGTARTVEEAIEQARKIGYENGIMIKASEGGGGKGIRFITSEDQMKDAYIQVSNEVAGSPIFIMQLCKNARHLEVQIVGDEYGNAVALSGRDCSTQRRFQKIFEEGPPIIAKPDTFKFMQKAAQRLTQNIGYIGAGTVEYLYNADTDDFFFLELNPRLQVEHPVTEGITDVNLPATQLQVAMGIPLYNIPQIRALYGKDDIYGKDKIDFIEEEYKPIKSHVIAARITAENPDEGFKPTSGKIERIKFQSTSDVWGYFSVGANGGIHEYADSQFGHLFAKGATREQARKALILALKEIEVRGEIRTTVEYLVELLETKDFIENTIDTSWLDGLIKEKTIQVGQPDDLTVTAAAIFRAFQHVKEQTSAICESLGKGQVSTAAIPAITSFHTEVSYKDTKYPFQIQRLADDVFRLTVGDSVIDAQVTETAEGALLATFGGETHRIYGMDEPLGLRLVLDGVTTLMPTIFDPSELRTDVTGKVVRYLHDSGADVKAGEPFVEVEAMKMIMPIKATESGKIHHTLSPGSVIAAGDLLATLELKDPSKVKKIETFSGKLEIENEDLDITPTDAIKNILAGYSGETDATVTQAFEAINDVETASHLVTDSINEFLRVENHFAGKLKDDVVREMAKANKKNLEIVIAENQAHMQLPERSALIQAMLRQVETFSDRYQADQLPEELSKALTDLSKLKGKPYGELALAADDLLRESKVSPFADRVAELRSTLLDPSTDFDALCKSAALSAGVDLLSALFNDSDDAVRRAAMEVYVRRVYRQHRMKDISMSEVDGRLICDFAFQTTGTDKDSVTRRGQLVVVPSLDTLATDLPSILQEYSSAIGPASGASNMLHIASASTKHFDAAYLENIIVPQAAQLKALGVRTLGIMIPHQKQEPYYYNFPVSTGYVEDPLRRNLRPTFHHSLEIGRLTENFNLERIPTIGKNAQIYLGNEKSEGRAGPHQVVFLRAISHSSGMTSGLGARKALVQGLDELERAQANSKVSPQSSSRIFLLAMREIEGATPQQLAKLFNGVIGQLKSTYATRLLKLRVDEIEVKVRLQSKGPDGEPVTQNLRLVASSMEGEWLKPTVYLEKHDPHTGEATEYCVISADDGISGQMCVVDPYSVSNSVQTKRAVARRVGSTYAYDFLGLMEVGLVSEWAQFVKETGKGPIPTDLFESREFIQGPDGELVLGNRPIGTNKNGMVGWLINMKTPEYPEGREVVVIANDVTVQSGSFGVEEDEFFYKASVYARDHKIPRIYIACNAGARIGLVDDLKSKLNVKFVDPENPAKGFEYLYLTDKDYKALPEGTVIAEKKPEGWALTDVIGQQHGIGVENLQGSGKIAGETSAAYDEIFTLSYVTGRSVGIGAYLVRLGQRVIQMKQGPIILTGYSALNKLLGREVYTSQDQLGGPQIMYPNGVAHEIVEDDQAGIASMIKWLSFVSKNVGALPATRDSADPISRKVEWRPTPTPYDPRLMMGGEDEVAGFFDRGSFKEYLGGWGKAVVVGRGRLGGIPMGAIAVETRLVEQVVPADPADPNSREAILPQAGQVLFPDSSYKTAQAIRDFAKEGLPVMIFANWRGFSGGSRDMAGEILKFGSMIVDALREYEHPVYMYIPPHGELRGGSWVVVDPTINKDKMEMYADPDGRGGILEPAGITEIKFRQRDQLKMMHRTDPKLKFLDAELEQTEFEDAKEEIQAQIKAREDALKPVYLQAATEFADLHDKTGRMKAKGVIKSAVKWEESREFFYWRAKRRMLEDHFVAQLLAADDKLTTEGALDMLKGLYSGDFDDNKAVVNFYQTQTGIVNDAISAVKLDGIQSKIASLQAELKAF
eukprot:Nitzschia sp. Nitz4//scaffold73_size107353//70390//77204//NITZ4_004327-RA/size107353-processed-gene-0.30-mRNA-1//-1//CDS//3329557497//7774//frame0